MTPAPDPDRGAVAFAERLLTVLGEGRHLRLPACPKPGEEPSVAGFVDLQAFEAALRRLRAGAVDTDCGG